MSTYTFHISGTHCTSCKIFIEDTLQAQDYVNKVNVDIRQETIQIETNSNQSPQELAVILTNKIKTQGYTISVVKTSELEQTNNVFWQALPIGLGVLFIFFMLQKSGWLDFGINGQITPFTSLIIGLIASVSSCLAVVGGLVLSLSTKISQDNVSDTKTFLLFHGGRLISFAILGGILGTIGNTLGINFTLTATLGLLASLVMLLLGLNLVGVFKHHKITLPDSLFTFLKRVEHKTFAPITLGFATFFLPCGFTQAMQIVALSSGSFWTGSLIMLSFALGTLPVLAFLSFGSSSLAHSRYAPIFFKASGIVVIGFGLFTLLSGLAGLGIINPIFNI